VQKTWKNAKNEKFCMFFSNSRKKAWVKSVNKKVKTEVKMM
jgi:hypothetical protein